MLKRVDTIILGATALGLGYAHGGGDVLILEKGELMAPEFTATFRPIAAETFEDCALLRALTAAGTVRPGAIDTLSLTPPLSRFVLAERIPVHLRVRVVSCTKDADGWTVETITNEGLTAYTCATLIDTDASAHPEKLSAAPVSLTVLVSGCTEAELEPLLRENPERITAHPGWREGEWHVAYHAPAKTGADELRAGLIAAWERAFPNGECRISHMALSAHHHLPQENAVQESGICYHAGAAYTDPIAAFCAGGRMKKGESGA